jgi:hypothetical protein
MKPPKDPPTGGAGSPQDPKKSEPQPEDAALKALADSIAAAPTVEKIETKTLAGDIRDVVLTHFRAIKVPWAWLSEQEQADKIEAIEKLGRDVARRAVFQVAASDMPILHVTTGQWTVKDQIELKVAAPAIVSNIKALAEHGQSAAVLVLVDPGAYMGEREKAKAEPDQPPLPFDPDTGEIKDPDAPKPEG